MSEPAAVGVLRAPRLLAEGFAHAFSTRLGGVSAPPFDSLNLSRTSPDEPAAVAENYRRFREAIGVGEDRLFEVSQIHSARVVEVAKESQVQAIRPLEADALVTAAPGAAVAVRTADCLPLLLADRRSGAVAAVHAGWRGVEAGIVPAAVERMIALFGARPSALLAAIGPHIRADRFEVGEEVAARLQAVAHGVAVVIPREPRPHVDLTAIVHAQLRHLGLEESKIEDVGGCTLADGEHFFSYRRDKERSGRQLSAIRARS